MDNFSRQFIALLLEVREQQGDVVGSVGSFHFVGKVLSSDDYLKHVKTGRLLCKKQVEEK